MKVIKNVTINCDASFCDKSLATGYAFYIVSDLFRVKGSGTFKAKVSNPTQAEMMCIGNAFHTLAALRPEFTVEFIVVNCDCKSAMMKIEYPGHADTLGAMINRIMKAAKKQVKAKKIHFRHVPAHSGTDDKRSKANEWCDAEAKKHMKIARKNHATGK